MTYSLDFRTKVFRIKEKKGLTFEQVSDHFDISIRTLFRWQKKLEPTMTRNKPATKINMDRLEKDIERHPDDYQWEPGKRLGVTQSAIHYALQRLGVSYKKRCNIQRRTNRPATPSFIWMKAGLLRICPGRMAIRKREHVVTGLRIALFDGRVNSDVFMPSSFRNYDPKYQQGR